ncbi:hypothetical protein ACFO0N_17665 [Halobium salinum]|uniref:Uncharacterized protein n=1 Tax=Halobium salinum TaxID=1364940 RepID=A0ABD5PG60_9EURY|nr:hypothetical protein [Halobium salinum]
MVSFAATVALAVVVVVALAVVVVVALAAVVVPFIVVRFAVVVVTFAVVVVTFAVVVTVARSLALAAVVAPSSVGVVDGAGTEANATVEAPVSAVVVGSDEEPPVGADTSGVAVGVAVDVSSGVESDVEFDPNSPPESFAGFAAGNTPASPPEPPTEAPPAPQTRRVISTLVPVPSATISTRSAHSAPVRVSSADSPLPRVTDPSCVPSLARLTPTVSV